MTSDPVIVTELDELVTTIQGYDDPRRAADQWKQVYKQLQKTDVPPGRITSMVGMRDVERLGEVIAQLAAPETCR